MSPLKEKSEILSLHRLGKIKLGKTERGDDGRIYYVPADHLICPDEVRKVFGERPIELRGILLMENGRQHLRQCFRCYTESGGLVCRGDGDTAVRINETEPGCFSATRLEEISCNPDECAYHRRGDCRRIMSLYLFLPDSPSFGVYQLDTCSPGSINNINSELAFLQGICFRMPMIRVSLNLEKHEVQPGGLMTTYALRLTCLDSLTEIQRHGEAPRGGTFVLPSPGNEPPDDFFPERPVRPSQPAQKPPAANEGFLYLWARVKSKIWHYEIQESQISNWFAKNYHIEASLLDFDQPLPPAKFDAQMLSDFYQSIERYASH